MPNTIIQTADSVNIAFLYFKFNKFSTKEKLKSNGIVKIPKIAIMIAPFIKEDDIIAIAKNV